MRKSRNDGELKGADDAAFAYGDDEVLVRVRFQVLKRGSVRSQVVK